MSSIIGQNPHPIQLFHSHCGSLFAVVSIIVATIVCDGVGGVGARVRLELGLRLGFRVRARLECNYINRGVQKS